MQPRIVNENGFRSNARTESIWLPNTAFDGRLPVFKLDMNDDPTAADETGQWYVKVERDEVDSPSTSFAWLLNTVFVRIMATDAANIRKCG